MSWTMGKRTRPADSLRNEARRGVEVPSIYLGVIGVTVVVGFVFALILVVLALLGIRVL